MIPMTWMPAKAFGGKLSASVVVVHCTESDNNAGTAESLAGPNWFGGPKAGTSAHRMFDRDSGVEMVKRSVVAFHAGPRGNTVGVSYEFCGRVSWSAAKWREPAQLNMLRLAAPHIAADLRAIGAPARWLSLAQLAARAGGMCTHNDVRLALGGTTHSDPGPNFPYAELLSYVQAALAGTPTAPTPEEDVSLNFGQDQALAQINDVLGADGAINTDTKDTVTWLVRDMQPRVFDVQLALTNALPVLLTAATRPGGVDVQQLAAATAALLGPALVAELVQHQGITEGEAQAAAERAVRTVLGSLA